MIRLVDNERTVRLYNRNKKEDYIDVVMINDIGDSMNGRIVCGLDESIIGCYVHIDYTDCSMRVMDNEGNCFEESVI